jgi:hypothetical protein
MDLPASPGKSGVVEALQIQPKLGTGAKERSQTKGCVPFNGECSVQNLCYPIGWHVDLSC